MMFGFLQTAAIRQEIIAVIGIATSLAVAAPVQSATFDLNWTGQTLGYTAKGRFSFDDAAVPADGMVRAADLTSFDIAFFAPDGTLLAAFPDNPQTTAGFNFNFDTTTGEILQTGRWDTPSGINIGGVRGEQLNFFSVGNPGADLFADDAPSPHVHLTDWGNDFPDQPVGFSRGIRPHLDIAFFTRTRAEVLADATAGAALGQPLIATKVPEPASLLALSVVPLMLGVRRRANT